MSETPADKKLALRRRAESLLPGDASALAALPPEEIARAVHELQVHQIELEIQNETLRNTQLELSAARDRFALLFNQAPVGYVILDEVGTIQDHNETFMEMVQRPAASLLGKGFATFLAGGDIATFLGRFKAFFTHPDGKQIDVSLRSPDNRTQFVCLEGARIPARNPEQLSGNLLLSVTDVSDRTRTQMAIQSARQFWQGTVDGLSSHLAVVDLQGAIIGVNQAWKTFADEYGLALDQHGVGSNYLQVCETASGSSTDEGPAFAKGLRAVLRGSLPGFEMEYPCHSPTRLRWFLARITPLQGEGRGKAIITHDEITSRKFTEQLLRTHMRLANLPPGSDLDALLREILDTAETITGSQAGFFYFVHPVGDHLSLQAWSSNTAGQFGHSLAKGQLLPLSQAGALTECFRTRRPVVRNDLGLLPSHPGLSADRAAMIREIAIPVVRSGRLLAILGLGNKPGIYLENDATLAEALASMTFDLVIRKQSEEILRENEEKFRAVFRTSPDAVCITRLEDGLILDCNERFCEFFGYQKHEVAGLSARVLPLWDNLDDCKKMIAALKENGHIDNLESLFRSKDGRVFTGLISARTLKLEGHFCALSVLRDISERKRAELVLASSEAELRAIHNHVPIMLGLLGQDGRFLRANRALAEFAGRSPDQIPGLKGGDVIGCLDALSNPAGCGSGADCSRCTLRLALQEVADTGLDIKRREIQILKPGGSKPPPMILLLSSARVDLNGRPCIMVCLEDITRERQMEAHFRQAQKLEAIGLLAGGIAHDFNNILASIMMQLASLGQEEKLSPSVEAALADVNQETKRAAALTRQLLLFSRRELIQPKLFDLSALVVNLAKMLARLLGELITLDLSDVKQPLWIEADPGMIEQVIVNLCINARDAMPKGGQVLFQACAVHCDAALLDRHPEALPGRFAKLTVTDSGSGIDPETLKHIFEPFFTTKEVGKGTGLGLPTVLGIVKQHSGWIALDTTVGVGTSFHVHLPLSSHQATAEIGPEEFGKPRSGTETILLVEDEASVRLTAAKILRQKGYQVFDAANGPAALRIWEEQSDKIDLLVTDMIMPEGMTGFELIDALHAKNPRLPAIIFSGYVPEMQHNEQLAGKHLDFLSKPVEPSRFLRTIREVLDRPS